MQLLKALTSMQNNKSPRKISRKWRINKRVLRNVSEWNKTSFHEFHYGKKRKKEIKYFSFYLPTKCSL